MAALALTARAMPWSLVRRAALALALLLPTAACTPWHQGPLPGEPAGARFVRAGGARVHVVDEGEGEGPPVVLIHGFASSLGVWAPVLPVIADERRVVAMDLKGFGWTDRPPGDYSPSAQADLVLEVLDRLGVEGPVALVAHSWGSGVALQVALKAPRRVERIALYDAWVYQDQLPTTFHLARLPGVGEALIDGFYDERTDDKVALGFHDPRHVTEELIDTVEEQLARPGTHAGALAAIRHQDYTAAEARYPTIGVPVLLLWGREDRVTTLRFGERLLRDLPDARLVVYPGCGHFPMIEARAPSTRDLLAFLREGAPAAAPPAERRGGADGAGAPPSSADAPPESGESGGEPPSAPDATLPAPNPPSGPSAP